MENKIINEFNITAEEKIYLDNIAKTLNVKPDIHNGDLIFNFLYNNPVFHAKSDAIRYYFNDGLNSVEKLNSIISEYRDPSKSNTKLLEFASGYGCLTRHFKNILKNIEIVSSDIHTEANDFISSKLNGKTLQSTISPADFPLVEQFDFVFVLSFFSHMPITTWQNWFEVLSSKICSKDGFLIFTTQGIKSLKFFPNAILDKDGYWFQSESEQIDLSEEDYGNTIVTFDFVYRIL